MRGHNLVVDGEIGREVAVVTTRPPSPSEERDIIRPCQNILQQATNCLITLAIYDRDRDFEDPEQRVRNIFLACRLPH